MTSTRNRLSVREGFSPTPVLREGVPDSLEETLRDWIWQAASRDSDVVKHAMIRLDLVLSAAYREQYAKRLAQRRTQLAALTAEWEAEKAARMQKAAGAGLEPLLPSRPTLPMPDDPSALFLAFGTDAEILWDVVDDLLHELCTEPLPPDAAPITVIWKMAAAKRTKKLTEPLRELLEESRSVYEITPDLRGLRRRSDVFLAEQIDRAGMSVRDAGRPAADEHLLNAYHKLYALHPDPSGAYVEMILAVEAVASPQFLAGDPLPTLGKVRAHLAEAGTKYEFVLTDKAGEPGSTDGVVAMIGMLWNGHSDRHEGGPACIPVSQGAAETALNVTVALVNMFGRGAVRRRVVPAVRRSSGRQALPAPPTTA